MQKEETGKPDNSENLIDIFKICAGLWKRFKEVWWILILIVCVCVAGGMFREKRQYHATYEASASFVVSVGGESYSGANNYYKKVSMEQLNSTFPYILTSGILNEIVANDLGMSSVPGTISANVLEETNLFQIKVVSAEPQMAYDILQSVIKNYPSVAKYVIGDTTLKLIDESGVPENPITVPNYKNAAAKGGLAGVVLGFLILLLRVLLRRTVKDQDDIKKFLNVKYLTGIPQEKMKKRSRETVHRVLLNQPGISYAFRESLGTLQVRFDRIIKEKAMKTVVVTSTFAGEGKTTISCNLAYAMAEKGYKVLLIDGDFRNPSVASVLELTPKEMGIADILKGKATPEEAVCQYMDSNLWVIPGVESQSKVGRLYRNGRLKKLIAQYQDEMDLILIDTPPCGIMNDAALAADCADGVMLVIRQDYAYRDKILEGVEMLSASRAHLLGCVINGEETGIGSYGYGRYGYGKYGYGKYGYGKYGYGYGETK